MIQLLGLRDRIDKKSGKSKKYEAFFANNWRAASVPELFSNIDHYVGKIPEDERWNMYFTVASCLEQRGRKLEVQKTIPFDIDDIDVDRMHEYIEPVCKALNVSSANTGVLFSGHGLQFFIELQEPLWITDEEVFDENRVHYKACCGNINQCLYSLGLSGSADVSVWSPARLMRLPNTLNKKPNREIREAKLLSGHIIPVAWEMHIESKLPEILDSEQVTSNQLLRFPKPDTNGVLEGCEFIKRSKTHGHKMSEPQWYAMLSVLGRLDNGRELCHEYSKIHEDYTEDETDTKMEQAMDASGPRTCENVASMWKGCIKCPHYGKLRSPILIRSESFIKTKDTGFHEVKIDKNGNPVPGKPNYEDMRKYYEQLHTYRTLADSFMVYNYSGKYWKTVPDSHLLGFARDHFHPYGDSSKRNEFRNLVQCTNLVNAEWFSIPHKINFQNGILDLETMDVLDHAPEFGFRYVLPYAYDKTAECPRFSQFLDEVTLHDKQMRKVIEEYMGYCLSYDDPSWGEKAMILVGEGSNGKSVLLDVMKALAGKENYSSLTLSDLHDPQNRYELDGKLFNLAEETPSKSLSDSSLFKNLVTGGETMVKVVYKPPFKLKNMAKLLFACNELPWTKDVSFGMFRRLLIVPFNARFTQETQDKGLRDKLRDELPGIMNVAIAGLKRLKAQGNFSESEAIQEEVDIYHAESDSIRPWFDTNVVVNEYTGKDDEYLLMQVAYNNYKFEVDQKGMHPEKFATFCRRLKSYFSDSKRFIRVRASDGRRLSAMANLTMTDTSGSY